MKFKRSGALAITPKALGFDWLFDDKPEPEGELVGDVAVVTIRGPLSHHDEWWFDSYDSIVVRAKDAFESGAKAVVFSCDSPGGELSGLFDTCKELRRIADASGKAFVWYVDGESCSAAMALACAADHIVVPEEGRVGSIGVIAELWDETEAAARWGSKCTLITSGERKADGHPMSPPDKDTIAAVQGSVDTEAEIFFSWVAERRGLSAGAIAGWQAAVFHGAEGVALGLADEIGTFSGALSMVEDVAAGEAPAGAEQKAKAMRKPLTAQAAGVLPQSKAGKLEDARKVLGELAGEDSDEGRRARKMLDAGDAEDEEETPEEKPEEKKDDEGDDSEDGDEASASAEDEEASSSAESESGDDAEDEEAKAKAEDEEAKRAEDDAKKCEAEANKAESEEDEALSRGDAKAARASRAKVKAARARRDSARSRAKLHRSNASVHRSLAKVHGKVKSQAAAPKPKNPLAAKLASSNTALAARGDATPPGKGAKPPTAAAAPGRKSIDQVDPKIRAAAGIQLPGSDTTEPLVSYSSVGMSIGSRFANPQTARDYLAKQNAAGERPAAERTGA